MRLQFAVCVDGTEITREAAEGWPDDDPLRATALDLIGRRAEGLTWTQPGEGQYPRGPLMAAAALKRADPEALITICVWPADV